MIENDTTNGETKRSKSLCKTLTDVSHTPILVYVHIPKTQTGLEYVE